MQKAPYPTKDAHLKQARICFIFDLSVLLVPPSPANGNDGNSRDNGSDTSDDKDIVKRSSTQNMVPAKGAAEVLAYLEEHNISFVIAHKGVFVTEEEAARQINARMERLLPSPIAPNMVLVSTSPLRYVLPSARKASMENITLVIGGDGEQARRRAWDYGYPYVITCADIAALYDKYSHYHRGSSVELSEVPSDDPQRKREQELKRYVRYRGRNFWRLPKRNKRLRVEAILVFWTPDDWQRDAEIVVDLKSRAGLLGFDDWDPKEKFPNRAKRLEYLRLRAPEMHMVTVDLEDGVSPMPGKEVGYGDHPEFQSWRSYLLKMFKDRVHGTPLRMPDLHCEMSLYGHFPGDRVLRNAEFVLMRQDRERVASSQGVELENGRPAVDPLMGLVKKELRLPPVRFVYVIGGDIGGHYKPSHLTSAKWRDVMIKGQELHPRSRPSFVATSLRDAVGHALDEGYWDVEDLGAEAMWPAPTRPRPDPPKRIVQGPGLVQGYVDVVWDTLNRWCCCFPCSQS